ncbi:uncharacterized protein LOC128230770 [Mya arenaria]|uniref:uncharacterized protein LOC128230770 n=1 Tax=Mya arenaria TaxID=6604 RepID=UPI0022E77E88|nr:uncharacterized protein LOC128230770 [Mya arenaria]
MSRTMPYDEKCNADVNTNMSATSSPQKSDLDLKSAKDRWSKLKTSMNAANNINAKKHRRLSRGDSFLRKFSTRNQSEAQTSNETEEDQVYKFQIQKHKTFKSLVVHPSGGVMFYWLGIVTLAVLYNIWTCIAREAFREIQRGYMYIWFLFDGLCDFVYVCDIFVQFRTGYLNQGLMVYDSRKLCKNYTKDKCFIVDIICLLPLDFLQFYTGIHPMLRFPRFLKIYRGIRFMHMYESRTAYPNLLRVASLTHILFLGSHWFAAFYYLISEAEHFEGDWSYPKPEGRYAAVTRKYLASLYWSTLTLTTIGDLPPPDSNWQYIFVIVSYLIGVFIFATIVGQVGNVITNRNASRQEFERLLDGAKFYMQMHNVPTELQKRVQRWYDYVWTRGRLNCNDINSLGLLPDKLKTELALHVNLGTLKKVTIFQKCRPEFLHDLMLKMRAYIFTPGDLICRRGEVAREMFIIADGVVEILGENGAVLTQMSTGDFFGEIGILNIDGGINRRTADVRSVGYSELFVLSREDVLSALKDHPDAEQIIREYGQRRLKETEEHRKMMRSAPSSPDPTAFRGQKNTNKVHSEYQGSPIMKHLPHVKCLQKLPQMSPKLRKLFSLRSQRLQKNDARRNNSLSEKADHMSHRFPTQNVVLDDEELKMDALKINDNGINISKIGLDCINEKDSSPDNEWNSVKPENGPKLADLVLNLLKTKRQLSGYSSVDTDDQDIEKQFEDIKIDNINEITAAGDSKPTKTYVKRPSVPGLSMRRLSDKFKFRRKSDTRVKSSKHKGSSYEPPQIVLTPNSDTTLSSSSSSSSSDGDVFDGHSNRCVGRSDVKPVSPFFSRLTSRKSSPCILPVPSTIQARQTRKYSCTPPLDLPIEVPKFSNFRGLGANASEIHLALDRFNKSIESRMGEVEIACKETQCMVQDSISKQEKILKSILKKLSPTRINHDEQCQRDSTTTSTLSSSIKSIAIGNEPDVDVKGERADIVESIVSTDCQSEMIKETRIKDHELEISMETSLKDRQSEVSKSISVTDRQSEMDKYTSLPDTECDTQSAKNSIDTFDDMLETSDNVDRQNQLNSEQIMVLFSDIPDDLNLEEIKITHL